MPCMRVTAQQAQAYKPRLAAFDAAFDRYQAAIAFGGLPTSVAMPPMLQL